MNNISYYVILVSFISVVILCADEYLIYSVETRCGVSAQLVNNYCYMYSARMDFSLCTYFNFITLSITIYSSMHSGTIAGFDGTLIISR